MVGDRLKQIRIDNSLSQKALADILGTSSGYISEVEQGKKMPGSEFLLSLKRELGVSLDWLLTGEGGPQTLVIAGPRIESYRRSLRLKVGELARIVGIPSDFLSDIESQKVIPSTDDLKAIIQNTDINPHWLSSGEGPKRKGDNRTGDGRPFYSFGEEDTDNELRWKILEIIHSAMLELGLDSKGLSDNKRIAIRDLLYDDAIRKDRQPDRKYAEILCRLTYCDVCEEEKTKETWKSKWGIATTAGIDLDEVTILVKAPMGLKCPMEGMPRKYITDSTPVTVQCTAFYRKLVDEGSLILVKATPGESQSLQRPEKAGNQVTQTVSGTGHRVAGRDIIGEKEGVNK